MPVRTTTLDNGMTVITDSMPHLESAALGVWVKSGSRSERIDQHGISHLLEHMAFKGTATRSAREIAETIEAVGGDINAATSIEHTGYFARVLKDDVGLAAGILADILQHSVFEDNELAREQRVICQEIGASHDNPDDRVFDLFQEAAFPDQPLGRTILGTEDSVRGFDARSVRDYMGAHYVGDQMVLSAAGNVDHDELVDLAAEQFQAIKATGAPQFERARYSGGDHRESSEHEQAHIVLGLEGRAYNSDGFYAVQILSSILGGGMSSRLFQEVRERRGLCYAVYAFHWAFADSGIFGVAAATGGEDVPELVPVILDELHKAANDITDDEVLRVRAQIRAGLLMSLESPSSRAGQLARQHILWGRPIPLQETVDRINKIDAGRVRHVAGQIFEGGRPSLASIGPVHHMPDYDRVADGFK
ncbi:M16 family metallopeptidase [Pelagibacterium montanilacus]|uniref:M16 family metallopeptidase n=1 Tax=Pelagibacterium montanilacus TaxID=2185280 RepID=UPI000F8E614C|nr:pitrilysin family protein [Pelagibacterium montanilacus]